MSQTGLSEGWILGAWIIAGIITMFGAFTISGLSSITEESGGIYEYLRLSFGNFFSFTETGHVVGDTSGRVGEGVVGVSGKGP